MYVIETFSSPTPKSLHSLRVCCTNSRDEQLASYHTPAPLTNLPFRSRVGFNAIFGMFPRPTISWSLHGHNVSNAMQIFSGRFSHLPSSGYSLPLKIKVMGSEPVIASTLSYLQEKRFTFSLAGADGSVSTRVASAIFFEPSDPIVSKECAVTMGSLLAITLWFVGIAANFPALADGRSYVMTASLLGHDNHFKINDARSKAVLPDASKSTKQL